MEEKTMGKTNKELQSENENISGFGLQRRLAPTDTYDITKILSRGGKGKSFTMIFLFGAPGDENVCNFLLRRDRWKNPIMGTTSRYVYSQCFTR